MTEDFKPEDACPWLPAVAERVDFSHTRRHGQERGPAFYLDALRYSQALWLQGRPAQAILQLNKAWMADLPREDDVLTIYPPPYRALAWMLRHAADGSRGFIGNPVRHFQHLASRISGRRMEIRSWRAWACFHIAERELEGRGFSRDGEQIAREGLWIPGLHRAVDEIRKHGWAGEAEVLEAGFK